VVSDDLSTVSTQVRSLNEERNLRPLARISVDSLARQLSNVNICVDRIALIDYDRVIAVVFKMVNSRICTAVSVLTLLTSTTVYAAPFKYSVSSFTKYWNGLTFKGGARRVNISYPRNCEFKKFSYSYFSPDEVFMGSRISEEHPGRTDIIKHLDFPYAKCEGYLTISDPTGKNVCEGWIMVELEHPTIPGKRWHYHGGEGGEYIPARLSSRRQYGCNNSYSGLGVSPLWRGNTGRRSNPQ